MKRHAWDRRFDIHPHGFFPDRFQHAFEKRINVLSFHKRRFHVDLGEFHLPVGSQILITETAGDLEILFHPGNHQDLFILLRRLR